jgi:hypothetical protein
MAIQGIPTAIQVLSEFVYIWNKRINKVAAVTLQFICPVNCDISTQISIMFGLLYAVALYWNMLFAYLIVIIRRSALNLLHLMV